MSQSIKKIEEGFTLAAYGWIRIQPTYDNIRAALNAWRELANQKSPSPGLGNRNHSDAVLAWARATLQQAHADEGYDAPDASVSQDGLYLDLRWTGTWTKGREFFVTLEYGDGPHARPTGLIVGWDTATGNPSRFLSTHNWVTGRDDPNPERGESWEDRDWTIREDALDWGFQIGPAE